MSRLDKVYKLGDHVYYKTTLIVREVLKEDDASITVQEGNAVATYNKKYYRIVREG